MLLASPPAREFRVGFAVRNSAEAKISIGIVTAALRLFQFACSPLYLEFSDPPLCSGRDKCGACATITCPTGDRLFNTEHRIDLFGYSGLNGSHLFKR